MNTRPFLILSRAFFFLGAVVGFALSVIIIWNNIESTNYYFNGVKYPAFKGLQCPVMIAPTEKGIVTVAFNNPTDEEDTFFYRAQISGRAFSQRKIEDQIAVLPHRTKEARFTVDVNDVDLLFFILVKITILPNSVHHTQEATCGILVANILGLNGGQVSMAALLLSLSGIAVGLGMWGQTNLKADRGVRHAMQSLGLVVLLSLFASFIGWWGIAIALSIVVVLLIVISMRLVLA